MGARRFEAKGFAGIGIDFLIDIRIVLRLIDHSFANALSSDLSSHKILMVESRHQSALGGLLAFSGMAGVFTAPVDRIADYVLFTGLSLIGLRLRNRVTIARVFRPC